MTAQMYSFVGPGGNQISLRPEFTSSIARFCIEKELRVFPFRARNGAPVFRYIGGSTDYHKFYQKEAELLGSSHPRADADVLAVGCQGLAALDLNNSLLVLGDLGLYNQMLEGFLQARSYYRFPANVRATSEADATFSNPRTVRLGVLARTHSV